MAQCGLLVVVAWLLLVFAAIQCSLGREEQAEAKEECVDDYMQNKMFVLVKVGGSSITDKAKRETLNEDAIEWLSKSIVVAMNQQQGEEDDDDRIPNFVLVHGAGSYGHHHAKEYGLSSQSSRPSSVVVVSNDHDGRRNRNRTTATTMEGLSKTRLSVQSLNHVIVSSLVRHGIPAIGISPCFGIPGLQAHGGDEIFHLRTIVADCIRAGLVPVIHGDACLYGSSGAAGILSGDAIMEVLGTSDMAREAIFLTDVDGVFTADPRIDPESRLLRTIDVDAETGRVLTSLNASGSSHSHDVTGGLKAKLAAATSIAASGTDVIIVKCASEAASQALQGTKPESGTLVTRLER